MKKKELLKEVLQRVETLEALAGVEKKKELVVGKWYKHDAGGVSYF